MIQTRLKVGERNDGLEQEAGRIGLLQRKCTCEGGAGKSGECEKCKKQRGLGIQTKLTINDPGDQFEQEADQVANRVMRTPDPLSSDQGLSFSSVAAATAQRKCAACEQEEGDTPVQMKSLAHAITPLATTDAEPDTESSAALSDPDEREIEESPAGAQLPQSVRNYMEPRFGADFSAVRLHSGPQAARLNDRLHSQAFTYGTDIWLGGGESAANLSLLAHELTHVLQQSPSLIQSPQRPQRAIQRQNSYFSLAADKKFIKGSPGARTHETVMADLAEVAKNKGLLFEVNIPGANIQSVAKYEPGEKVAAGRADLYKSEPKNTPIGVQFIGNDPTPLYLEAHRSMRAAGGKGVGMEKFPHAEKAAPVGKKNIAVTVAATTCPKLPSPAICRLAAAPQKIYLGDIKPAGLDVRILGEGQLRNYEKGIKNTAVKVTKFAEDNPANVDANTTWNPTFARLGENDVKPPAKYKPGSTAGTPVPVYRFYQGKPDYLATPKAIYAYLYLTHDKDRPGIWMYEYVPVKIPKDGPKLKEKQKATLGALDKPVREKLKAKPQVKRKRKPGPLPPIASRRIQRQIDKSFDYGSWIKNDFKPWQQKHAKPYLESTEGQNAQILETLIDIKSRTMPDLALPTEAGEIGVAARKIRHWNEEGTTYGRLRQLFGDIYWKFLSLHSDARDRFRKLLPRSTEGPGGLAGKLIKVGMKILRYAAHIILGQVAKRLADALATAAENLVQTLFGTEITAFEEELKKVQEYIKDFKATIKQEDFSAGLSRDDKATLDLLLPHIDRQPPEVDKKMARLKEKWWPHSGRPMPALLELLKVSGFGIDLPANEPDLDRIDSFLEAINGDGKLILNYIKSFVPGWQAGKKTLQRILSDAQQSILKPPLSPGPVPTRLPEPKQEEGREEGGVVIYRW